MKALLIYKTKATRWVDVKDGNPHYQEVEITPKNTVCEHETLTPKSSCLRRNFSAINYPARDGFIVFNEE